MDRITHARGKNVARWGNDYRKDSVVPYHFDHASLTHLIQEEPFFTWDDPSVVRECDERNS